MIGIPKRHFRVCTQVPLVNAKNAEKETRNLNFISSSPLPSDFIAE